MYFYFNIGKDKKRAYEDHKKKQIHVGYIVSLGKTLFKKVHLNSCMSFFLVDYVIDHKLIGINLFLYTEYVHSVLLYQKYLTRVGELIPVEPFKARKLSFPLTELDISYVRQCCTYSIYL